MKANDVTTDTERITANINIEIVDNDGAPKIKYTNPWGAVAVLSFIAMLVSLFVNGIAFLISYAVFLISIAFYDDKSFDKVNNPWKYKD